MAQYKINIQLDGIEIYFDEKPTDDVLQRLRDNRWRWHRGKHCWYSRISEESLQFANELCNPTHSPKITFPPKSTMAEQTPSDNSAHITYRMISGGETLAHVTISKNGDQYTVSSTNNQLVCSDCHRVFSIHALSCPFCGSPIEYILKHDFNEITQRQLLEQQIAAGKQRTEAAERIREERLARQREKEEIRRREAEERQKAEKENQERKAAIERICAQYAIESGIVMRIYQSGISPDKLKTRIDRILYYRKEHPYLEISLSAFITNDTIDDYVARNKWGSKASMICTGICSDCTREACPMEHI